MEQMDEYSKGLKEWRSKAADNKKKGPVKCTKCNLEDYSDWGCRQGQDVTCIWKATFLRLLIQRRRHPLRELNDLLVVEGAGGHLHEYLGYIKVNLIMSGHPDNSIWDPMMVAPDTPYNKSVPLLVGTNVVHKLLGDKENNVLH